MHILDGDIEGLSLVDLDKEGLAEYKTQLDQLGIKYLGGSYENNNENSNNTFKKIETIGFTTRYRAKDKKALKDVLKIAMKTNAKVKCLYVKTNNSDVAGTTIKQWEEEFKDEPVVFSIIPSDDVQDTILDFVLFKDIDVLAMLTYKRNFFVELFNPSLTQKFSKRFWYGVKRL